MPKWKDLKRFCERDGWELYKSTDHYYYRKDLGYGEWLYTKVSFGSGEIPKNLFKRIMKEQLRVTLEDFNKKI